MRIERIATKQGHAVPSAAHAPRGPFPPELFYAAPIVSDYEPQNDSGQPELPLGATAQNNYRGTRLFECSDCGATLTEQETYAHDCE